MTFPLVTASVMAADLAHLDDDIRAMDAAGIDGFHWDVMDGHFVPNMTFGPDIVKALRGATKKFFDVHIMVDNPEDWIAPFAKAGADAVTFHAEASNDHAKTIAAIKAHNIQAGIAFNPETDIHLDAAYVTQLDRVLIMTVHPGFGGQDFIDMSDKIKKAALIRHEHSHLQIVVDGGINASTARTATQAGATVLVSGSGLFKQRDYKTAIDILKGGHA